MKGYIYKITCLSNNKFYIGSTNNFKNRKYTHFSKLRLNKHKSKDMQKDFNLYGKENFKMEIVFEEKVKNQHNLINLETYYFLKLKPKYNKNMPCYPQKNHTEEDIAKVYNTVNL